MRIIIEVVACSVKDALVAEECGADRIELCSAIEVGGLTPSIGLVREVLSRCSLPIMAMVRPRAGGFRYSESELLTMRRDIEAFAEAGVHGIVLGVLAEDATIDEQACRGLIQNLRIEKVFHRAIDLTPDLVKALESLVRLGFTRLLTSGRAANALDGAANVAKLVNLGGLEVMAGGGVRAKNAVAITKKTGVLQTHFGPFRLVGTQSDAYGSQRALDREELASTIKAIRDIGSDPS